MKLIDLTGNKYGKLTVIERVEDYVSGGTQWLCKCKCGRMKVIRGSSLKGGRTTSCGCGAAYVKRGNKIIKSKQNKANICIDCKKACGDCSWSEVNPDTGKVRFEPVPGWTAEEVPFVLTGGNGYRKIETTYKITACPEFEPDERKNCSDCKELTKEESDWFLMDIRRILRRWADEDLRVARG